MMPGSYSNNNSDDDSGPFPKQSLGPYAINPKTGLFQPGGSTPNFTQKQNIPGVTGGINDMVRALMAGYLRKKDTAKGPNYESAAPTDILQDLKGVNGGYKPAGAGQYGGSSDNTYSALFNQVPTTGLY